MTPSQRRIFISYRRDDTAPYAGWLHELLAQRFGKSNVFKDVSTVRPGMDFAKAVMEAVASSSVLIVLIGPSWSAAADDQGRRRLEDPKDWVRVEIEAALDKNLLIIPVLVRGVRMPSGGWLPPSLLRLTHMQALQVDYENFEEDVKRLVYAIETGQPRAALMDPVAARREHGRADRFAEIQRFFRARIEQDPVSGRIPWRQATSFRAQLDALVDALDSDEELVNLALALLYDPGATKWAGNQGIALGLLVLTPRRLVYAPRPISFGVSVISHREVLDLSKGLTGKLTLTLPDRNVEITVRPSGHAKEFANYMRDRIKT